MKSPPPWIVRRLVLAPALVLLTLLAVGTTAVLWILLISLISRYLPGRWRPMRATWVLAVWMMTESLAIIVLFGTWILSGFGWKIRAPFFLRIHYRMAAWYLRIVVGSARKPFNITMEIDDPAGVPDVGVDGERRSMLVFARHAGPGDSMLIVDGVLNSFDRNPRIVLKALLRIDPAFDILLSRTPNRFVGASRQARAETVEAITELAGTMGPDDAFILFPEGANFTERRRTRAIAKLEEIGRDDLADRAEHLRYLLPPRPVGALAAVAAAPDADVVFVGHCGLEQLSSLGDLWRGLPMDDCVRVRLWRVPAECVPPADELEAWLFDQWNDIDTWLAESMARGGGPVVEPAP